jgi:hypothetical protein
MTAGPALLRPRNDCPFLNRREMDAENGASDRARTGDIQNHNLAL